MATLLESGVSWLGQQLRAAAGLTVRYVRGNSEVELIAVPGRADQPTEGSGLEAIGTQERDWLIDPADLVIDGDSITPLRGDRIVVGDGENAQTYEVVHRGNSECFRYTDQSQQMVRVYTQEI